MLYQFECLGAGADLLGDTALVGCFLIGATIANHLSPSSDLFLPSNAAAGQGPFMVEVVAFALGAWLVADQFQGQRLLLRIWGAQMHERRYAA